MKRILSAAALLAASVAFAGKESAGTFTLAINHFLFGPRGTGKTTWLSGACRNAFVIDLLKSEQQLAYRTHPEKFVRSSSGFDF